MNKEIDGKIMHYLFFLLQDLTIGQYILILVFFMSAELFIFHGLILTLLT